MRFLTLGLTLNELGSRILSALPTSIVEWAVGDTVQWSAGDDMEW